MAAIDSSFLQAMFDQPPAEAMAYLQSKGLRITFNWQEMLDEAHARAFTVAKAMRLDVLRDIRGGLLDAMREGKTLRQFQDELTPQLQAKGWWGKQIVVGADGQAQQVQLGSPRRLKTIYQTNLQSAYMAGRAKAQMQASSFPYLMYVAVMDGRTRPSHAALNGKIWRKDDPVWLSIYPPNGFNCRCRTRALTQGQMRREGLSLSEPPELLTRAMDAGADQTTGEMFPTVQTGVRVKDARGRASTMWVDAGFNSSPLAGHPMDELLGRKAVESLGDAAGFDLVRQAVLSDTRIKAWHAFVDGAFGSGVRNQDGLAAVQGQTMTAGILPLQVVRKLAAAGDAFAPVVHVPDQLLVGKKALRHGAAGDALEQADWQALPGLLPDAHVYRDTQTGQLIMVYAHGTTERSVQLAVARDGGVRSAYLASNDLVEEKVRSRRWEPV